jgi:phosphogluconate dehydratase
MTLNVIEQITSRIIERSKNSRQSYLQRIKDAKGGGKRRGSLSCGNLAHACAASSDAEKHDIQDLAIVNLGIVSAYNDMLSAHQPYKDYPDIIKMAARNKGAMAQVAGGVPAMCDGITQGQDGMELSLFSRDVIAMATAIALSHNVFDGALCLGVCDKIVPGLLMGALSFGHLPIGFVPAGPMPSGLPNADKAKVRQDYAIGKVGREELFAAESASYHSAGTCTFYGTANTNQMLMELMGLHIPGSAFVNPGTELREKLTISASEQIITNAAVADPVGIGEMVDEKAIVNAIVGLLATGGSTNLTIHLIAIARIAGININWDDFNDLSEVVPLVARVYPNGLADVNHFHAAGGFSYLVRTLLDNGYLHEDVKTIVGTGLRAYQQEPFIEEDSLIWREGPTESLDSDVLKPADKPFSTTGGLRVLEGNLGRSVIKYSAVKEAHLIVEAPAKVFTSQADFQEAFASGDLHQDFIAVLKNQGPSTNGMPELHKLTPPLGVLQDLGYKVALVTDGRMSGASGKVPAAIHLSPEGQKGGAIELVKDGDMIRLDAQSGHLELLISETELAQRQSNRSTIVLQNSNFGMGRELFQGMRDRVSSAELGAVIL